MADQPTSEHRRLAQSSSPHAEWRLWGPYVSARQWGTVREDYSSDGDAWRSFPFEHAHRRAYRWGEDGIAGLCDRFGFLNLTLALWNGRDDRLKERLFGLTNHQGNHGEDVKEYWWHLDATPTHAFGSMLYRYPQAAFPYEALVRGNGERGLDDPEFELADTGVLADDRFFDVVVTHAKASPDDIVVTIEATNHGPDPAPLHLIPQLTFANTWSWGRDDRRPRLEVLPPEVARGTAVAAVHGYLGRYVLHIDGDPDLLLCDNETNTAAVFGADGGSSTPKDGIDRAIVSGDPSGLRADGSGTRLGVHHRFDRVEPGESVRVRLRLAGGDGHAEPFVDADAIVRQRREEADAFYATVLPGSLTEDDRHIARRAFAGLLWCRQVYRYSVDEWLEGDPAMPPPPQERQAAEPHGRNSDWRHLSLADVISMPDEWEYPWFASWDLAFHAVALARVDPAFAKEQLLLMCREWAQHPNGQLPAYEWSFSDVNPPVHAWAAWQVYLRDGRADRAFLTRIVSKLLMNFSWWVNRKDADGSNLFEGGFLGMDNVSVFDRSEDVPAGWRLEQSDATGWMAAFCLEMLRMAQELAREDPAWDDTAGTFLTHFLAIAHAMRSFGSHGVALWDEADGFFYDVLVREGTDETRTVRVRSLVGLLPMLAVTVSESWVMQELPDFTARMRWLRRNRPELLAAVQTGAGSPPSQTLSAVEGARVRRMLARLLDEGEFLGPFGVRSLSAAHRDGVEFGLDDRVMTLHYTPGVSDSAMFGGNSNWRGPVWFPVNALIVSALRTFAAGSGAEWRVPFPTGSDTSHPLGAIADRLEQRLIAAFRVGPDGRRPCTPRDHGRGPLWDVHPTFSEYFDGDTGEGLGATHQTGWTALVADMICRSADDTGAV